MQYGKKPAEGHLGLVTKSQAHFYSLMCCIIKILRCWELPLVDFGVAMCIKVFRKKITSF